MLLLSESSLLFFLISFYPYCYVFTKVYLAKTLTFLSHHFNLVNFQFTLPRWERRKEFQHQAILIQFQFALPRMAQSSGRRNQRYDSNFNSRAHARRDHIGRQDKPVWCDI